MDSIKHKLRLIDATVLGYIINKISDTDLSDQTILFWQDGSVKRTSPPTPLEFHGDKSFRAIRHLPPVKNFSGKMVVNRHGGKPKTIQFD